MADADTSERLGSPIEWLTNRLRSGWRDLRSVYYANTTVWRLLKSAALLFMGLALWVGANLVLSYRQDWTVLWYVAAYGFAVIFWGPFTHFVIVPLVIRARRSGTGGLSRLVSRHGSKVNFAVFLLVVLALGTAPIGAMTFDFQVGGSGSGGDVDPDLQCTKSEGVVHCHLSDSRGIESVAITSGGERLKVIEEAPYDFDVNESDVATVNGQKQFAVELRDENGGTLRRYVRRVELIPG